MSGAAALEARMRAAAAEDQLEPSLTPGNSAKLGMWVFLAGDAMTFGAALAAYGGLRYHNVNWPNSADWLGIGTAAVMTFILLGSSLTMAEALSGIRHGDQSKFRRFLLATIGGGLIFLAMLALEWTHLIRGEHLSIRTSLFGATFFLLTGFHGLHVVVGVTCNSILFIRALTGGITRHGAGTVEVAGLYWHFVDLVWIVIFTFVYLL
jgi:cytochrome c oxidase subunit III